MPDTEGPTRWRRWRRARGPISVTALEAALALMLPATAPAPVSGAAFTTINESLDGTGHCKNSANNCNIYDGKDWVWINGGPAANGLGGDGIYFFAVLSPGGQPDPNDGAALKANGDDPNLSDDIDSRDDRTFGVESGEIATYFGPHDFDSGPRECVDSLDCPVAAKGGSPDGSPPYLRLFDYLDTPNSGGVYIAAICRLADGELTSSFDYSTLPASVTPSDCKYDAFKVLEENAPVTVQSCFSGLKYRDDNRNGQFDPAETPLEGWDVKINGTVEDTTDANGLWSFCTDEAAPTQGTTDYLVQEVPQNGWAQTGNTVDQFTTSGGANVVLGPSVSPAVAAFTYLVTVPNDAIATADGLNFGNVPQGTVWGAKYYDANTDGQYNAGDTLLSGWPIRESATIFSTGASFIDGNGFDANFVRTLNPGTYTYSEVQASNWIQTGNTVNQTLAAGATTGGASASLTNKVYTVTIPNDQPSSASRVYFGNVCLGRGGGLTIGFWSNKNGQVQMNDGGTLAPELALLVGLNLRNANGSAFDPTTYNQFKNWLLNATATNMAYMLSAQLAGMALNVEAGFVSGSALVWDGTGFVTVSSVMSDANTALGADGFTPDGDPNRAVQEALKITLDRANNNLNFLQPTPATCPTPAFPS